MKASVNGIQLHYEVHGEGAPVVLAHGWLDDTTVWDSQVQFLASTHKVVTYDLRGRGRSDKPGGSYSIETQARDMYGLIAELGLGQVAVVGHSMGGMIAMMLALNYPDSVSKLALLDTTAKLPPWTGILARVAEPFRPVIPYGLIARIAVGSGYYRPSSRLIENGLARAMKASKYAVYECYREVTTRYDLRGRVSGIGAPTLIVVGARDTAAPVEMGRFLNREIAGSELRIIPDSGHMVMLERPDELNRVLAEFLGAGSGAP